jgi:hypothetical protein
MDAARRDLLLYALTVGLFVIGVFVGFQQLDRIAALFISGAGVSAIVSRKKLAATQNRLLASKWRYLLGSPWSRTRTVRPLVFLLWGIGCLTVAVGWLIGG